MTVVILGNLHTTSPYSRPFCMLTDKFRISVRAYPSLVMMHLKDLSLGTRYDIRANFSIIARRPRAPVFDYKPWPRSRSKPLPRIQMDAVHLSIFDIA